MPTRAFERIMAMPDIEQRSQEWYTVRDGLLTASDAVKVFNEKSRIELIVQKLSPREPVSPYVQKMLDHGVRMEPQAIGNLSTIVGKKIHEKGLTIHPKYNFIGASPDGVTEDGWLVEAKSPCKRMIKPGHVPEAYYAQMQLNMEVFDSPACYYIEFLSADVAFPTPRCLVYM